MSADLNADWQHGELPRRDSDRTVRIVFGSSGTSSVFDAKTGEKLGDMLSTYGIEKGESIRLPRPLPWLQSIFIMLVLALLMLIGAGCVVWVAWWHHAR